MTDKQFLRQFFLQNEGEKARIVHVEGKGMRILIYTATKEQAQGGIAMRHTITSSETRLPRTKNKGVGGK